MALTADVLLRLARFGGASVATLEADGTATQVHPHAETWYGLALVSEDSGVWGSLYLDAIAAKTAHWCLKFPWNDDAIARGVILSETLNAQAGTRTYKGDASTRDWWMSTPPGAQYVTMQETLGSASSLLCF